jgi:uncharacterized membrane protein YebE (DUF533 family)
MDAVDILGALLGRKPSQGGPAPMGESRPSRQVNKPAQSQPQRPMTINESAASLEDLLGVAKDRQSKTASTPTPQRPPVPSQPSAPVSTRASLPPRPPAPAAMNEQAKILVRAMIAAAKADGQLSQEEQNAIVKQIGNVGDAEVQFLRAEFSKPVDVKDLAWSIPLGMEEQAYAISLMAIELDEQSEAAYLGELAHGLRLQPARCNEIHRKYGAPEIFR